MNSDGSDGGGDDSTSSGGEEEDDLLPSSTGRGGNRRHTTDTSEVTLPQGSTVVTVETQDGGSLVLCPVEGSDGGGGACGEGGDNSGFSTTQLPVDTTFTYAGIYV